ncbi:MAG: Vitamin B12-dependent ribonucleotide reductase, partial [Planctomycetota bacterium]
QLATDIVVSKYFRKAGVPQVGTDGSPMVDDAGKPVLGPERSVRQVVHRLAGCWTHWGEKYGYFSTKRDAEAFYDELAYMLLTQMAAPNSPQWFNTGLNWAYGIQGPAQGHWLADHRTGATKLAADAYTHPQPHACFIQAVKDDLVSEGGIMDLWTREARLFKFGSGTGTNFSQCRGENEPLSGGGKSSGLMSFLKIGDRAAGAIKSGGTTRRAAKMVCLDLDHPDVVQFVRWKAREEIKVAALVEGLKVLSEDQKELAKKYGLKLDYDFNGEAYYTVSGQNSNNSVRIPDEFFDALDADTDWNLTRRTDGKVAQSIKAKDLWAEINFAAWRCADPGVQYDSTINAWHTCPAGGRINASNPCSEYMFLDNTACNLASINLMKFYDAQSRRFDIEGYEHAISLWTIVLEVSVLMAAFPSKEIADLSWRYRTLGLGYANLGAMLMQAGIPYDSEEGRAVCGMLTSVLTGRSYAQSALLAAEHGPFAGFAENRETMLRVVRNHRRAAMGMARTSDEYENLRIRPVPIDHSLVANGRINLTNAADLLDRSVACWDDALGYGEKFGFRNAQTTVIAPTGTIGLLMDCDTTGVEPDFALVKFKKLAGGGYFKIANQSLRPAIRALGYTAEQADDMVTYVMGTLSLDVALPAVDGSVDGSAAKGTTFRDFLLAKGFSHEQLVAVENSLPTVFELAFAFSAWSMPENVLANCGVDAAAAKNDMSFNGLRALGLSRKQIDVLNRTICGTQTIEGAPHLKDEHLPVFDCANRCGPLSERFIKPEGHIRMMAASQPFITGAISKTINLPSDASVEDIGACYRLSWELGLKANALYRDGCKLSQPLSTKSDKSEEDDKKDDSKKVEASVSVTSMQEVTTSVQESETVTTAAEQAELVAEATTTTLTDFALAGEPVVADVREIVVERVVERIIERPMRRRLADTRDSVTHKFNVAGHEGYLIVGLYEDGRPGELFITMAKEGSTIGGLMDSLGTAISVALQYGVPVESLVTKFAHQRFEPMGMTTNADIPFAKSLVDYIFRWLGMQFIAGYRELNAPRRPGSSGGDQPTAPEATRETSRKEATITTIKEDASCANGSGTTVSGWATRREAAISAAETRSNGVSAATGSSATGFSTSSTAATTATSRIPVTELLTETITETTFSEKRTIEAVASVERIAKTAVNTSVAANALDASNAALMGDAPACDVCGSITVRNGTCYRCLNCGNSMGCS